MIKFLVLFLILSVQDAIFVIELIYWFNLGVPLTLVLAIPVGIITGYLLIKFPSKELE